MHCAVLHGANKITFLIIYYVNGTKVESDSVESCYTYLLDLYFCRTTINVME